MCGIAGFCLNPAEHGVNRALIAGELLAGIEPRGRDATGAAWISSASKQRVIAKRAVPASAFRKATGDNLCRTANAAILHTRWATQGTPQNNDNNHPIQRGQIILTHNGHIGNDREIFKRLNVKRVGQVDTEAAAALLAFGKAKHPTDLLPQLRGTAALAWVRTGDPHTLHLARVSSSPLWLAQTAGGSLLYASTQDALLGALVAAELDYSWLHCADEGEYFRVHHGAIVEHRTFMPYHEQQTMYDSLSWDEDELPYVLRRR